MRLESNTLRRKRLSRLTEQVQRLVKEQPEPVSRHSDRVMCITRFLCAQYTRTYGSHTIPVKDLTLIYLGALLHDVGALKDGAGRSGEALLNGLIDEFRLTDAEAQMLRSICLNRTLEKGSRTLYGQIVILAERYDHLTFPDEGEGCTHEEAVRLIRAGRCGSFDISLLTCLEEVYRELHALHECSGNHARIVLLSNIYRGDRRYYWLRKRVFDVVASSLGLLILSPVLLLICLLIVIDDPRGGPFFKQTRVGRHKRLFKMYKFRTMYMDAEARKAELEKLNEKDGPVFKIANDPRVTRVGRFLRKTSLDELPQLLNVIKGEMTLVGPRPPIPREVENYTRYDEMRLSVTPGLTCVWQVQPRRDSIRFDQWVDMDLAYIGTRSQLLDIRLLFRTVFAVLGKSGS